MLLDLQLSSAHNDWPRLADAALRAEADGYDTFWVLDHLDGTTFRGGDRDLLECFTFLGALAVLTATQGQGRINIGPLVANVANRHPAITALAAASVQRISAGRLRLGIGAGASPDAPWAREHHERGIPLLPDLAERHAAVVHQIEVLRTVRDVPAPLPVIVGVNSVELARIAGQHADGVNVRLSSPRAADQVAAAREVAAGRPFEVSGWADHSDRASQEKAHDLGLDRLVISRLEHLD